MPDRDLKLNSLSRYSKQSPRLVLEEYGHCEVPAGCGGAVLRWRNPDEPIPMTAHFFYGTSSKLETMQLDGVDIKHKPRIPLTYNTHVLTIEVKECDLTFGVVMFYSQLNADYVRVLQPEGDLTVISLPDGTWRCHPEPSDSSDWQNADFDDSTWLPMVEKPLSPLPKHYGGDPTYWTKEFIERGAKPLGLDTDSASVPYLRVRKVFTLRKKSFQE